MSKYIPDFWVVLKIDIPKIGIQYRVLGAWGGGYLDGDSWRLNSGITRVVEDGDYYVFSGNSGSEYRCYKENYGLKMATAGIYQKLVDEYGAVMLDEDTDWPSVDWGNPKFIEKE